MCFNVEKGDYGYFIETKSTKIKILQLTDTQVIDSSQCRFDGRLGKSEYDMWRPEFVEKRCYSYIREAIMKTNPDLIIMTGDLVYGEFDDSGKQFLEFVSFMESFGILWAPVFGNHDNEAKTGVEYQCNVLENAENCLFMRGNTDGNGNYTVTLLCKGVPFRTLIMLDSHGCNNIAPGIYDSQTEFCVRACNEIKEKYGCLPPLFAGFHIATSNYVDASIEAGYEKAGEDGLYGIGSDVPAKSGDFGHKYQRFLKINKDTSFFDFFTKNGGDGIFCGHWHKINTSILYRGVRLTFGLKTGIYDSYNKNDVGGTLISLNGSGRGEFSVRHIYSELHKS